MHQCGTLQVANTRKGGPSTKLQQEKRRKEVHRLHIEFGYPAVKIAEMMKTNRNTINNDIKIIYSEIAQELQADNIGVITLKQIQRFEMQRTRLMRELEKDLSFHEKLGVERLLFDVDNRISQIITKIHSGPYIFPQPSNTEPEVPKNRPSKKEVIDITAKILKNASNMNLERMTEKDIQSEIMKITKGDIQKSNSIVSEMTGLGLELCLLNGGIPIRGLECGYDFKKFANIHGLTKN